MGEHVFLRKNVSTLDGCVSLFQLRGALVLRFPPRLHFGLSPFPSPVVHMKRAFTLPALCLGQWFYYFPRLPLRLRLLHCVLSAARCCSKD